MLAAGTITLLGGTTGWTVLVTCGGSCVYVFEGIYSFFTKFRTLLPPFSSSGISLLEEITGVSTLVFYLVSAKLSGGLEEVREKLDEVP